MKLTSSASRYQTALESAAVPVAFADLEGRITEVNPAMLELLRCTRPDEVIGHLNAEFVADAERFAEAMRDLLARRSWRGELPLRCRDGSVVATLISASVITSPDGTPQELMASFVDITKRRRVEDALYRSYRALRALASVRAIVAASPSETEMFAGICRVLVNDAGYGQAWIGRALDGHADHLHPVASAGVEADAFDHLAHADAELTIAAVRTQAPTVRQNNGGRAMRGSRSEGAGPGASTAIPVVRGGSVFGALTVHAREPGAFDDQELSLLVEVAGDLSRGLDHLDALAARHARDAQRATLAHLGQFALDAPHLDALLNEAVDIVSTALNVELVKVLELRAAEHRLVVRAGVGWRPGVVGRASVDATLDSQAAYTLHRREPVIVAHLRTETRFAALSLLTEHGVVSGASVAIGQRENPFGVLSVHSREPRSFTADDGHFLMAVANIIATAAPRFASKNTLLEREAYFRALFENASDLITVVDRDGLILFQSPSSAQVLGMASHELVGQSMLSLVHEDDVPRVRESLARAASTVDAATTSEHRVQHADGSWRFFESIGRSTSDAVLAGAIVVHSRDVTERRAVEEALREREAMVARQARVLEETQRAARIGGFEVDMRTGELYFTDEMYRLFETTPNEFAPSPEAIMVRFSHDSRQQIRSALAAMPADGGPFDLDVALRTFRDRVLQVRLVGLVQRENGRPLRVFGAVQDLTEHRQLEERVRQSQKMEAIGQLSGGVAHDFNNLLTIISGNAEIVKDESTPRAAVLEAVREITEAVERASGLTRQLLLFGRRQTMQMKHVDLNAEVDRLTRMLRRIIGEDVHLQLTFAPDALPIVADPGMLDQVLMNLAVNARDAMPDGGRLTIETSRVENGRDDIRIPELEAGACACLAVSDTGHGIPADVLPHIFEPFFTTKDVGKGTGLGLATVYGIVHQHHGRISVESDGRTGSTFRIHLPLDRTAAQMPGEPGTDETTVTGTELLLLVEDEDAVRTLERRVLTRLGYRVLEARSGPSAMELWAAHGADIDLLVTDVIMPDGVSGVQLARQFCKANPRLRVLFASGYSAEIAQVNTPALAGAHFIGKPFDLGAFGRAVRDSLDAPPPRLGD